MGCPSAVCYLVPWASQSGGVREERCSLQHHGHRKGRRRVKQDQRVNMVNELTFKLWSPTDTIRLTRSLHLPNYEILGAFSLV